VLDESEMVIAKHIIADEFFQHHKDHMYCFGDEIANSTHAENVKRLETSENFKRQLQLLHGKYVLVCTI
jgi:hypothetical protein